MGEMKCQKCGVEMIERKATDDVPYQYKLSGLENVFLSGIMVRKCLKCGAESPIIPKIGELHKVMAETLVEKPERLSGAELRFLRKNAGFPAVKFAALLGVDPSTLSRVENGRQRPFGPAADRLARILAVGEPARDLLLQIADKVEAKKKSRTKRHPVFTLERNHWQAAA